MLVFIVTSSLKLLNQWRMLLHRRLGDITTKARDYSKMFISENMNGDSCLREAASSNKAFAAERKKRAPAEKQRYIYNE